MPARMAMPSLIITYVKYDAYVENTPFLAENTYLLRR